MGGCAGCVGPNRRAEKYRVSRLTDDSNIKQSVTPSQLPIRRYTQKVIDQLNYSKKRMDHNNNLINPLLSSLGIANQGNAYKSRMSSSALYPREQPTNKVDSYLTSSAYNYVNKKTQSKYQNQNLLKDTSPPAFDKSFIESRILRQSKGAQFKSSSPPVLKESYNYKEPTSSIFKLGNSYEPIQTFSFNNKDHSSDLKVGASLPPLENKNSSSSYKQPLKEVFNNSSSVTSLKGSSFQRSKLLKSNKLLNIPELPQQDAKTPQYVEQIRRKNGQDVKKTSLSFVPRLLQPAPKANLHKYLKDLQ